MPGMTRPQAPRLPLQVEALEDRCVLSTSAYVSGLFSFFLNRVPLPADLASGVNALNAGVSPQQVTQALVNSTEFRANLIVRDYQGFLQRTPASAEVAFWLGSFQAGATEEQLEAAILGSREFFASHGNNNGAWLMTVYRSVLGRPVDPFGLAGWNTALLTGVSREAVAFGIVHSTEAHTQLVGSIYQQLLARNPDAGARFWVAALDRGLTPSQFVATITASPEFIARFGGLDFRSPVLSGTTTGPGFAVSLTPAATASAGLVSAGFNPLFGSTLMPTFGTTIGASAAVLNPVTANQLVFNPVTTSQLVFNPVTSVQSVFNPFVVNPFTFGTTTAFTPFLLTPIGFFPFQGTVTLRG